MTDLYVISGRLSKEVLFATGQDSLRYRLSEKGIIVLDIRPEANVISDALIYRACRWDARNCDFELFLTDRQVEKEGVARKDLIIKIIDSYNPIGSGMGPVLNGKKH